MYETTVKELENRIYNLITENKQILQITDPWDLFDIPGFYCRDLGPSLAQASIALGRAKSKYNNLSQG